MYDLTSKGYTISTLKNILSLHVLLDYFDAQKLHKLPDGSALTTTLFQATGAAPENTGFVKITNMRGGNLKFVNIGVEVGFGSEDNGGLIDSSFVTSLEVVPNKISIIQISSI
ncbi:BnaC03g14100D [Brassica napus]|uniref:BnaC03g14100D protein n=1 Tax=Brassica napus TaxID=3708 RepID=A0A078FG93_BRANA|nr:BnaC03g14100D [Brassica napus]